MTALAIACRAIPLVQLQECLRVGSAVDFHTFLFPTSDNAVLFAFHGVKEILCIIAESAILVSFAINEQHRYN
jgi:hypothetical protein